jgi:signal transduction histidine kinase
MASHRTQLDLLSQMIEDISGELALDRLLARIVERACHLIGADNGAIGLYVPERDAIRTVASYNIPRDQLEIWLPRGHGLTGRVLELDAPVRCRYGELPQPSRTDASPMHAIGMPIRSRGRLTGVFGIGSFGPEPLDDDAVALLDLFARHAAIAIENARRYTGEQRRASRFALIARVAGIIASAPELDSLLQRAADAIHELLDYQNVDIPLVDPDDPDTLVISARGGEYKRRIRYVDRLPVGRGIMGAAALERVTQMVNDVRRDPRYVLPPGVDPPLAEMAVPILHGDQVLGVLNVEGDQPFDALDRISLEIIAEHLGTAIVNARLFERTRQLAVLEERQRLARDLHDNVTQIVSSMSLLTQSLEGAWQRDPAEAERRSARLGELARLACAELREMLHELAPPSAAFANAFAPPVVEPPQPLPDRLAELLQAMVPPHVQLSLETDALPVQAAAHDDTIVRICQEAVSNAVRHALPSRIQVSFAVENGHLRLSVSDDGKGMPPRVPRGMGLSNMCQRLHELDGTLQIRRRRPRGTSIVARLPLSGPES